MTFHSSSCVDAEYILSTYIVHVCRCVLYNNNGVIPSDLLPTAPHAPINPSATCSSSVGGCSSAPCDIKSNDNNDITTSEIMRLLARDLAKAISKEFEHWNGRKNGEPKWANGSSAAFVQYIRQQLQRLRIQYDPSLL